ncbi:outer membrane lipoprotein-sorting protein [Saprospira sp. CCB-QB6]|uniref:outer membrane lipoprotein-sorting protein n=1 Tax=Saprospira sp. CCB-QB6 TaxID=3023936 RepID=UPI00234B2063|nr:outer membrane lipoprotein-sorting protein [Saprospira sp. CCB-QB6]WCL80656.1 outer membrane lipoprotein-sorting protein [Saprospira sp. CCB-QB6]
MKKTLSILLLSLFVMGANWAQTASEIMEKMEQNMSSKTQISRSQMIIYGRRGQRVVESKSYAEGNKKAYTEYLAPARERGTKMLKLEDRLWIYSPATDRSIQLSGHLLRQSVMGSDLSYEDMMEDRKLQEIYTVKLLATEEQQGEALWVLELSAKVEGLSYPKRKIWVHQSYYVPVKEELYAKSGQLLKELTFSDIEAFGTRYYPRRTHYKDVLKKGKGTDFILLELELDAEIPAHYFNKAILKR